MSKDNRTIEASPRSHSSSYEIKPISRWYMLVATILLAIGIYVNGLINPYAWSFVIVTIIFTGAAIFCFPKTWLSKAD